MKTHTGECYQITNTEFIKTVFRNVPEGASPAVCSKPRNPEIGGWIAQSVTEKTAQLTGENNNYLNCSSFLSTDDGSFSVRKSQFSACHFLMLDDLGTKIPLDQLNGFDFSWLIETSPGNFQAGIIFSKPIIDGSEAERLLKALIDAGLCDPGSSGICRWARLPLGINGKPKYLDNSGNAFKCKLIEWQPETRYSPAEIIKHFDLEHSSPDQKPLIQDQVTSADTAGAQSTQGLPARKSQSLSEIRAMLEHINPDCCYSDWVNVLMAIFHESKGFKEGFEIANSWSSKGKKYKGIEDLRRKWISFRTDVNSPITIATLRKMVSDSGRDWMEICWSVGTQFVDLGRDTEIISPDGQLVDNKYEDDNPLKRFSLLGKSSEIEKNVVAEVSILGRLALQGQLTVFYAAPNTGKTLITLSLLIDSIQNERVNPEQVYYLNMDDNTAGLLEKLRIAEEYKFHVLTEGYRDFNAKQFLNHITEMIDRDRSSGVIIILDTLKKFVNLMDKVQSAGFSRVIRKFVMKGGTLIALAHTNKNPDRDGNPVCGGTSDILDDFDCAYTIAPVKSQSDSDIKLIEFENKKRRGNVIQNIAYSYSNKSGISYSELLASVQLIDETKLIPLKQAAAIQSDSEAINAVIACINEGINTKMKLANAVSSRIGISRSCAIQMIEKYTGVDSAIHKWQFSVHERGAKVFSVLNTEAGN